MTLVHLMRHGETEWNAKRRLQGQADIPLSDRGRAQVRAQSASLNGKEVHAVASDLSRAEETARLMGFLSVGTDPRLREINVGTWEGRPFEDLDAENYRAWRIGGFTPPDGEGWAEFCDRTVDALHDHAQTAEQMGRDLLLVCHGGVIRGILNGLLALPIERFAPTAPASLSTIRLGALPALVSYNRLSRGSEG